MNPTWMLMASVPLLFAPATGGETTTKPQKLVRVQSDGAADEAFDRDGWRKKLTQEDLDARERAFERVTELARRSDKARQALESWAKDDSHPDLAWTSRLALRSSTAPSAIDDLSGSARWNDLNSRFEELRRRFERIDPMFDDMQEDLQRLFDRQPFQSWNFQPGPLGGSSEAQSFSLEIGPDGSVTCEITEDVNGDKQTKKYTADSVEELLEAHPELRGRIGLGGGHGFNRVMPHGTPTPRAQGGLRRSLGSVPTDMLGIYPSQPSSEQRKDFDLDPDVGLLVERTAPGTIAEILGIQSGDIVIEMNGTTIHDSADVARVLKERESDGEVAVVIIDKKGQRRTLTWRPSER